MGSGSGSAIDSGRASGSGSCRGRGDYGDSGEQLSTATTPL